MRARAALLLVSTHAYGAGPSGPANKTRIVPRAGLASSSSSLLRLFGVPAGGGVLVRHNVYFIYYFVNVRPLCRRQRAAR